MNVSRYFPSILGEKIGINKITVIEISTKTIQIEPETNFESNVACLKGGNTLSAAEIELIGKLETNSPFVAPLPTA
ncbi:Uncharacterised protein [Mycoplasmopsis edwardii]|uniref:Uncharacterized protein n=1 Tax=Mycoplasmopsis edwardii TaxID=53558 RepID=A0A3B0Q461_9BACT|nr:Uncharacterised protein [Mycoplasmopsis edwardii]